MSVTDIVGGLLTALVVAGGGYLTAKLGSRANKEATAQTTLLGFVEHLMSHQTSLEGRVTRVESELIASRRTRDSMGLFIDRVGAWRERGFGPPDVVPPASLHPFIDATLWGVADEASDPTDEQL